jgi:hypothetical protein
MFLGHLSQLADDSKVMRVVYNLVKQRGGRGHEFFLLEAEVMSLFFLMRKAEVTMFFLLEVLIPLS